MTAPSDPRFDPALLARLQAELVADIRARTPLASLIGRRRKLERAGRDWKTCCPFHDEKTPSFTVYPDHYHCFGCAAHGDCIKFIRRADGLSFREAVIRLAGEAAIEIPEPLRIVWKSGGGGGRGGGGKRQTAAERDRARRIAWGQRGAASTVLLDPESDAEHVVAHLYLGLDRAVPYVAPYPADIRFDPRLSALVAVATDSAGQITGGQRIYLTHDGHKLTKAQAVAAGHKGPKETFGLISGSAARLPPREPAWMYAGLPVYFIVESIEAGAAVWQITGQETGIVFGVGNLRHAFRADRANVVCVDDDKRGSAAWKQANKAIRAARAAGYVVLVANTWETRKGDKADLDDILRQAGPEGSELLRTRLSATLYPDVQRRHRVTADDAVKQVHYTLLAFMDRMEAEEWLLSDAGAIAIRADTATNKSTIMRKLIAKAVRARREAGDDRSVVIFVPRIELAIEAAEKMWGVAPDLDVKVWLGRELPGMCGDLDSTYAAGKRLLSVQRHVCKNCPLAVGCLYQKQREQTADIWFVAHPMLFHQPPHALAHPFMAWVDETPIDAALIGIDSDEDSAPTLLVDVLRRFDHAQIKGEWTGPSERLAELRALALAAFATMPPGAFRAAPFRAVGLTATMCLEANKLEWATKIEPDEGEAIECADLNLDLGARTRFWLSLASLLGRKGEIASGWLRLVTDRNEQTMIRMRERRKVHDTWKVPTVLTDAVLQMELVSELWPSMRFAADVAVKAPHQHITQILDRSYSLTQLDAADPKIVDRATLPEKERGRRTRERARRRRGLRDVHAKLHQQARLAAPRMVLVVAQKRIVEQIKAVRPLPANVEFMHHGAVSGIDRYRSEKEKESKVARIVVIGRQAPSPAAVEACAEALTGVACNRLPAGEWYQRRDAVHELVDGRLVATERDCHPDAIAELFRLRPMQLELQQIIGRGGGIWRNADDPLHVLVLTDVPLGLPIDTLTTDAAERPSFEDRQMAAGGCAWQCAAHAADAYPDLWRNPEAAQYARRLYARGQPAGTVAWCFQAAGQGGKRWEFYAPPEWPADVVENYITARRGPLATFERAEAQPKGALNRQVEGVFPSNSMDFDAEDLPERPIPFVWQAWTPWRVEHPPDG